MAARILIKTSYKNAVGKNYSNEYIMNLSELEGIIKIGQPPPLYKIAKDIEVINDEIKYRYITKLKFLRKLYIAFPITCKNFLKIIKIMFIYISLFLNSYEERAFFE